MDQLTAGATRVLLADDHPLYRDALRQIVPDACPAAELVEACDQSQVLALVTSDSAFDLILLDLDIPGATGLSCLQAVRTAAPLTPVIVVSAADDPQTMRRAVLGGATGYVTKSATRQTLVDAIRVVLSGGCYVPSAAMAALRESSGGGGRGNNRQQTGIGALTSRQLVVLRLMARGLANKEIGQQLDISEITVKAHVSAILQKLQVKNRVQAILAAQNLVVY